MSGAESRRAGPLMAAVRGLAAIAVASVLGGCGAQVSGDVPVSTLTEAQRDSVIARGGLPGSATVDRALAVSDQAAARAARLDTLRR